MASTSDPFPAQSSPSVPCWLAAGHRYYSRGFYCRQRFGRSVWKVSLDAGCTCPNRDGVLATGGCIFCDPESFSPSRRRQLVSLSAQLEEGIGRLRARHAEADCFVAYFQPASNTYGPLDRLRGLYEEALVHPGVVGLAIGTRPDCAGDAILDLLAELSARTWVTIEYGLQTSHDRTLDWLGRGHHVDAFINAAERSRRRGIEIGAHVILGLPGESPADMLATARLVGQAGVGSVKLHNLYAVRNTRLAELLAVGQLRLPEREEYVGYVADFIEALPSDCVIDRLSGDAPSQYFVAPQWCLDKAAVRAAVMAELVRRDTWQGKKLGARGHA